VVSFGGGVGGGEVVSSAVSIVVDMVAKWAEVHQFSVDERENHEIQLSYMWLQIHARCIVAGRLARMC